MTLEDGNTILGSPNTMLDIRKPITNTKRQESNSQCIVSLLVNCRNDQAHTATSQSNTGEENPNETKNNCVKFKNDPT